MRKIVGILVVTLLIATSFPSISSSIIKNNILIVTSNYDFVSGEFIVKFKDGTKISNPSITMLNEKYRVRSTEKVFRNSENTMLDNIYLFSVPKDSDILSIVNNYLACPNVEYAEPNYIGHLCSIPNDPDFSRQWGLHNTGQNFWENTSGTLDVDIDAPEAWDIETGSSDIIIAIIDTGIDYTHPDLADNIWINDNEIPDNDVDDDENGYVDDVIGWDFYYDDADPIDENGHGTHCAGIASAVGNNGIGIAGVCWDCKIMVSQTMDENGYIPFEVSAEAIVYAADNGADVISMSFGSGFDSSVLKDAIDYAYNQGVVPVAAAGNDNRSYKFYPAGFDNVIAVAAINQSNGRTTSEDWGEEYGSHYGSWVDVAAPGNFIYSTMPTFHVPMNDENNYNTGQNWQQNYDYCWGTSMATPHVAGLVGLILSKNPNFNQDEILTIIRSTTDKVESDQYIGTGRINAYQAIQRESTPIANINSSLDDAQFLNEVYINGTASGSTFVNYVVSYGKGIYPDEWTQIHMSSTPVTDGVLAHWEPQYPEYKGPYSIRLLVYDSVGQVSKDQAVVFLNMEPNIPEINGSTSGVPGEEYEYIFVTRDPYKDWVYYYIEWGDGEFEDWIGPKPSGKKITRSHSWDKKDTFKIRCKAKDIFGLESDWGELSVTIPRNRLVSNSLSFILFERFFNLFPMLKMLLQRLG